MLHANSVPLVRPSSCADLNAAAYGQAECVNFLLDIGANPEDLASCAMRNAKTDVVEAAVRRKPALMDGRYKDGTLLLRDVYGNPRTTELVEKMLCALVKDIGIDVNANGPTGESIVHNAVNLGELSTIKLLKELGPDMNMPDASGRTPFRFALDKRRYGVADWLYLQLSKVSRLAYLEERCRGEASID